MYSNTRRITPNARLVGKIEYPLVRGSYRGEGFSYIQTAPLFAILSIHLKHLRVDALELKCDTLAHYALCIDRVYEDFGW